MKRPEPMDVSDDLRVNVDDDGRVWWSSSCGMTAAQVIRDLTMLMDGLLADVRRAERLRDAIRKQEAKCLPA